MLALGSTPSCSSPRSSSRTSAPPGRRPLTPALWLLAFPILTFVFMAMRGMYRPRVFLRVLDDLRIAVTATALAAVIILSLRVLVHDDPWVAAQTARIWAFATVYLLAGRIVLSWVSFGRAAGESVRPTLVVGAGHVGRLTAKRLQDHPELGLRPVGFLDKEPRAVANDNGLPVLGASWDLDRVVAEHGVKHVVLSFSTAPRSVLLSVLERCRSSASRSRWCRASTREVVGHIGIEYLGGIPLLTAQPTNPRSWQFAIKYAADRLVAALLLAARLARAARGIDQRLGEHGPPDLLPAGALGLDGRVFEMLKLPLDATAAARGRSRRRRAGARHGAARRRGRRQAHARRAPSCAGPRSTSCPSSGTCCAAR